MCNYKKSDFINMHGQKQLNLVDTEISSEISYAMRKITGAISFVTPVIFNVQ